MCSLLSFAHPRCWFIHHQRTWTQIGAGTVPPFKYLKVMNTELIASPTAVIVPLKLWFLIPVFVCLPGSIPPWVYLSHMWCIRSQFLKQIAMGHSWVLRVHDLEASEKIKRCGSKTDIPRICFFLFWSESTLLSSEPKNVFSSVQPRAGKAVIYGCSSLKHITIS